MIKAYKYQLYPTNEQVTLIEKHFGCCRWVYNYALDMKIKAYQVDGKSISRFDIQRNLPILKKEVATEWLSEVQAQALQASLEHLDKAYTKFFRDKKGFPKFKSKHHKQSYQYPQGVKTFFDTSKIFLPKLGRVDICYSRTFEGKIKTCTVSRSATRKYYVSILVDDGKELPLKAPLNMDRAVGIDLGLKDFAILSNGDKFDNPRFLKKSLKKLALHQRRASKKVKGSNNRKKANYKVAKIHERVTNLRRNYLHQATTKIIKENQFDTYCVENLNVAGMMKNRKLARSIADVSWSEFIRMLTYKAEWNGKNILTIGRFEPSSKTCTCGEVNKNLTLKDRFWTCASCNTTHDRDILAANNIKKFAFHPNNKIGDGSLRINVCGVASLEAAVKQKPTSK